VALTGSLVRPRSIVPYFAVGLLKLTSVGSGADTSKNTMHGSTMVHGSKSTMIQTRFSHVLGYGTTLWSTTVNHGQSWLTALFYHS